MIGDEKLKGLKKLAYSTVLVLFLFGFLSVPALANVEPINGAELSVASEDSGYKLIVPKYYGLKAVEKYDEFYDLTEQLIVVEVGMPEKDDEGKSLIFQLVTTDSEASSVESYPGNSYEQLGFVSGDFVDGRFNYSVDFDLEEGEIYRFNFFTNTGFNVTDLNFVFISENDGAGESVADPADELDESAETTETEAPETSEAPEINPIEAEIPLNEENSGYKIIVPSFIDLSTTYISYGFSGERQYFDLLIMGMPERNSDGSYSLFQLTTTDESATSVEVKFADEYVIYGVATGEFVDGTFDYTFVIDEMYDGIIEQLEDGFEYFVYITTDSGFTSEFAVKFVAVPESTESPSAEQDTSVLAAPTSSTVLVDGKEVAFDAYVINSNNYFKLRDLAHVVSGTEKQFEVSWDGDNNTISLESGKAYTSVGGELTIADSRSELQVYPNASKILVDGNEVEFTAYTINGNNYFKLRDIASTFNIGVSWDGATNTVGIDTTEDYIEE